MATLQLKAEKCPLEKLSLINCAIMNTGDCPDIKCRHMLITCGGKKYVFTIQLSDHMKSGCMGFSLMMRKWAELSIGQVIDVRPYTFDPNNQYIAKMSLDIDFLDKKQYTQEFFDTDKMAIAFTQQFPKQAFTVGQMLAFSFNHKILKLVVTEMEAASLDALKGDDSSKTAPRKIDIGLLLPNAAVCFNLAEGANIRLTGSAKGKVVRQSLINPDWDFSKMGIGGLDNQFNAIFRRAFASRVFPPEIIEQLNLKHVRGILLYGPPGTGKTLMARQIGKMLNGREPKVVNGPQILNKYVGESEANIRKLFEDAEEEQKRLGINSGLHIIIFDEIDAICKQRGSMAGASGVHDTVVNQLLSKIDGVESLNNVLVIGMTNRRDMIDEALLRPGRLEVQMEIGLPDEHGRVQILNIHTGRMKQHGKLDDDVDLSELAAVTKNFSGAELEGLVRAAQSMAMNRLIKAGSKVEVDPDALNKLKICRQDFMSALENDIKPAFGTAAEEIETLIGPNLFVWGEPINQLLGEGDLSIDQCKSTEGRGLVTVLLEGPPNAGKTALAARIALNSGFPFVKLCSPQQMVGYSEPSKCQIIKKIFDDAYKSVQSCVLVDDIERLLDYCRVGPRYSNMVLQTLLILLKQDPPKGRRLLVLCTSSCRDFLDEIGMLSLFSTVLRVPAINRPEQFLAVLEQSNCFSEDDLQRLVKSVHGMRIYVGIKKLLAVIDRIRQVEQRDRVVRFLLRLEEEGCITLE
ncbi:vesicle-fusing ATPase 1 isoform 2 [Tropilaelaps mercedesae]|uniref:Vesicle-fusing ATPase n=1 Tax=Tropilaelaps mercedesae TaxID=418985 RepID=A0A1V9XB88_9ACAR|nr:vesicle-fusing ATPase 1 isoform 2 [Tropilaelaps mercedesae]